MGDRDKRLETANAVLRVIASHGRRFFSQDADRIERMESPRVSRFEFALNGRLWYVDKYRGARIYVHHDPTTRRGWGWRFSDGGTLLDLCRALRDFILRDDQRFLRHLGPFPEWNCGGDLWGYGRDPMESVRAEVTALLVLHK